MSAQVDTADKVLTPKAPGDRIQAGIEEAHHRAENVLRRTKDRAIEMEHELEGYVRERPLKSVLIAAGVGAGLGLVLGVLLARR
ncbi:MAG TPA: hypothetical protein VF530_18285 [Planctomycetota bacterium]